MRNTIIQGDISTVELPKNLAQTIITSPPYFGLRNYGLPPTQWAEMSYSPLPGLPELTIPAMECCLGLEPTLEAYVGHLVFIFRRLRETLRDDGTCWLNLGDSFAGSWGNYAPGGIKGEQREQTKEGQRWDRRAYGDTKFLPPTANVKSLKPKDLMLVPHRVALALQADGWWVRMDVVWHKSNPLPESVNDRPTKAHEYIFLLAKSERYYYDRYAILEPYAESSIQRVSQENFDNQTGGAKDYGKNSNRSSRKTVENLAATFRRNGSKREQAIPGQTVGTHRPDREDNVYGHGGANKRSVWSVATKSYPDAHFATFNKDLIKPCILAGTSEYGACAECAAPWVRVAKKEAPDPVEGVVRKDVELTPEDGGMVLWLERNGGDYRITVEGEKHHNNWVEQTTPNGRANHFKKKGYSIWFMPAKEDKTYHWQPTCTCNCAEVVPCVVFDPFMGSGTTAEAAIEHRRDYLGVEMSQEYIDLINKRLKGIQITFF